MHVINSKLKFPELKMTMHALPLPIIIHFVVNITNGLMDENVRLETLHWSGSQGWKETDSYIRIGDRMIKCILLAYVALGTTDKSMPSASHRNRYTILLYTICRIHTIVSKCT